MKQLIKILTFVIIIASFGCSKKLVIPADHQQVLGYKFYPNGTYTLITEFHDVGGYDISLGTYTIDNETIYLERSSKEFVAKHTVSSVTKCEAQMTQINLLEFIPDGPNPLLLNCSTMELKGKMCNDSTITIWKSNGSTKICKEMKIIFEDSNFNCIQEIWLEDKFTRLGETVPHSQDSGCLTIDYPVLKLMGTRINPDMYKHKITTIKLYQLGKTKFEIEYYKDSELVRMEKGV